MRLDKNSEGYADPTAGEACKKLLKEENERILKVSSLVPILRATAELAGFEIIGRIPLKDKKTGKEYR